MPNHLHRPSYHCCRLGFASSWESRLVKITITVLPSHWCSHRQTLCHNSCLCHRSFHFDLKTSPQCRLHHSLNSPRHPHMRHHRIRPLGPLILLVQILLRTNHPTLFPPLMVLAHLLTRLEQFQLGEIQQEEDTDIYSSQAAAKLEKLLMNGKPGLAGESMWWLRRRTCLAQSLVS